MHLLKLSSMAINYFEIGYFMRFLLKKIIFPMLRAHNTEADIQKKIELR